MSDTTPQQPGTERRLAHLEWTETVSHNEEILIDVPIGYTGDLQDLLDVDNDPIETDGVPEGYRSNWLDRAKFNSVDDVTDREFGAVYFVDDDDRATFVNELRAAVGTQNGGDSDTEVEALYAAIEAAGRLLGIDVEAHKAQVRDAFTDDED